MEPYIINYARFYETRLVDANNQYHDNVNIKRAKEMAKEAGLDLICFAEPSMGKMALCKILDYGKWKYKQEKLLKQEKKNIHVTKEMRFTPVISDNDIEHKVKQIIGFLKDGDEVIVRMIYKGIHHRLKNDGERIINKIIEMCKGVGKEMARKRSEDDIYLKLVKAGKEEKEVKEVKEVKEEKVSENIQKTV